MSNTLIEASAPYEKPPTDRTTVIQPSKATQGNSTAPEVSKKPEKDLYPPHKRRWWLYLLIAVLVVAAIFYFGVLPRRERDKETAAHAIAAKNSLPIVEVVTVARGSAVQTLTLPGTVIPAVSAHIYAQAAGFLKARYVDIGDKVHRGQLLCVVSAPELDATVVQERSLVAASKDFLNRQNSQQHLARVTYDRIHLLTLDGVLSQQDDDVAAAALFAAEADVRSAQNAVGAANGALQHAVVMASFEQVRSPIEGTVTARNVEVGSLVSPTGSGQGIPVTPAAGNGGPSTGGAQGGELFEIANLSDLRTFVTVPEQDAVYMRAGQTASLTFSELLGQPFPATVVRNSDSLSQQTRSLLLEMKIADPKQLLRPGMYATVQIAFGAPDPGILVSGDSVITLARGSFVALVDNNVIHMRQVHLGRDLGTQVYVTTGLENNDTIVVNPSDAVQEGAHVVTRAAPKGQEK